MSWRDALGDTIKQVVPVGSRVTCDPPPTDTDEDFLVLIQKGKLTEFLAAVATANFEQGGSDIPDEANVVPRDDRFFAFRRDEVNLIATMSESFFRRFLAATHCAKRFNLLDKEDRIVLFQAVLYGNIREPLPEITVPSLEEEIVF